MRKGDGGFNYATTDVAGVLYRVERWSPARIIILTDERQQLHFKQLFTIARRLGVTCSLEHVWFGLMRLPEGTISTREGKLIGLEALLDEAETRALAVATESRAPSCPTSERREIARVVGIGAVKYNDLSKDRQTLVTFTWDKALSLHGNTAPYLQYAYARIQSILRKAKAEGAEPGALAALRAVGARAGRPSCTTTARRSKRSLRRRGRTCCATTSTIWRARSRPSTASTRCSRPSPPCARRACSCAR